MNLSALNDGLVALQAAWTAQSLYGPDHGACRHQMERATARLRDGSQGEPSVSVSDLGGRVYVGSAELTSGKALSVGLFAELRARSCDSVVINPSLTMDDVQSAVQWLGADRSQPAPNTGAITFGALRSAGSTAVTTIERDTIEVAGDVISGLETRSTLDGTALANLATDLSAACVANADTLLPLAILKAHDEYTYVHTVNVGLMSGALAEAIGLSRDMVSDVVAAALLHDVGKSRVDASILNKQQALTEEDFRAIREHPAHGAKILMEQKSAPRLAVIVAYEHHMGEEGGYPAVRRPWRRHLASQIVQIADVFDALRMARPYRPALTLEKVLELMRKDAGRLFDRDLLDDFFARVVLRAERGRLPGEEASDAPLASHLEFEAA